jgi:replicative DNA helicase
MDDEARKPLTPEQAVIGAALVGPDAHPAVLALADGDFTDARNAMVAAVIRDMIRSRRAIDAATVAAELAARGQTSKLPGGSLYLHELYSGAPVPVMAMDYAAMVRAAARVRRHASLAQAMLDKLGMEQAAESLDELLAWQRRQQAEIPGDLVDADPDTHTLEALMAEPDKPTDWIVPGLLERGERVVITGHEGRGKSVLIRQIATCLAAGVHPWTGRTTGFRPARVLQVDVENSRRQIRNGYRMVARIAGGLPQGWQRNITIHVRNDGVDLPGRDAGWFHQVAAECSPEVIVIGPAYKLMRGDPQRDRDVLELLGVLDEVRVRHNAALIIEHHSPHGDAKFGPRTVRPYGSSVWMRWPEVGMGLRNHEDEAEAEIRAAEELRTGKPQRPDHLDFDQWRPAREDRDWPAEIWWGAVGELPWKPAPDYRPSVEYVVPEEVA